MKKFTGNKKTVIIVTAFFVVFTTFFWCCLKNEAQARITYLTGQTNSPCHSQKQQNTNSTGSGDCACPHTLDAILAEKSLDILNINLSLAKIFQQENFYLTKFLLADQNQKLFSRHPPPILSQHSLPIYLQISALRI